MIDKPAYFDARTVRSILKIAHSQLTGAAWSGDLRVTLDGSHGPHGPYILRCDVATYIESHISQRRRTDCRRRLAMADQGELDLSLQDPRAPQKAVTRTPLAPPSLPTRTALLPNGSAQA